MSAILARVQAGEYTSCFMALWLKQLAGQRLSELPITTGQPVLATLLFGRQATRRSPQVVRRMHAQAYACHNGFAPTGPQARWCARRCRARRASLRPRSQVGRALACLLFDLIIPRCRVCFGSKYGAWMFGGWTNEACIGS